MKCPRTEKAIQHELSFSWAFHPALARSRQVKTVIGGMQKI